MREGLKELFIGVGGAVLGGVLVWLISENIRLNSQVEAMEIVNQYSVEAMKISANARVESELAVQSARAAADDVADMRELIESEKKEVEDLVRDLKNAPLFGEVARGMDSLRSTVKEEARLVAESWIKKESQKRLNYKRKIYAAVDRDCHVVFGEGVKGRKIDNGECVIIFSVPFGGTPHVQLTAGDFRKDDWDNVVNFHSVTEGGFSYQTWDAGAQKNTKHPSVVFMTVTEL